MQIHNIYIHIIYCIYYDVMYIYTHITHIYYMCVCVCVCVCVCTQSYKINILAFEEVDA